MTIDEMIEVLQAYKEGKKIQVFVSRRWVDSPKSAFVSRRWVDSPNPAFDFKTNKYRVKPIPMEIYVNVYRGDINRFGAINVTKSDANKVVSDGGEVVKFIEVIE